MRYERINAENNECIIYIHVVMPVLKLTGINAQTRRQLDPSLLAALEGIDSSAHLLLKVVGTALLRIGTFISIGNGTGVVVGVGIAGKEQDERPNLGRRSRFVRPCLEVAAGLGFRHREK